MRYGKQTSRDGTGREADHRRRRGAGAARARSARSGFTMVEMTVVIGIIMILIALAVVGYRYIEAQGSGDRTRTYLHNADAMVAELDRTGQGWRLEGKGGLYAAGASIGAPGNVTGTISSNSTRGTAASACTNVLNILLQVQANQDAYGKLPSKALISDTGKTIPSAMIDGWGNPMIWVPSGGLTNVKTGSKSDSSGNITYNATVTIKSPDGRGFWVSAGPDGDFTTGDDNIYSFQK